MPLLDNFYCLQGASMSSNSLSYSGVLTQPHRVGQHDPDLTVIVPTRNEAGNIDILLTRISNAFSGPSFGKVSVEVIFVDDSTDRTPETIEAAMTRFPDRHIRLIHRAPEQRGDGLGGAVAVGLSAARSQYACVMD